MKPKRWVELLRALNVLRRDASTGRRRPFFAPQLEALEARVVLDDNSAGPLGIVARGVAGIQLSGSGIGIGQVELTRPGSPSLGDSIPDFAHPDVNPIIVLAGGENPSVNEGIDAHAEMVAGVMIAGGESSLNVGVSPSAQLYAAAVDLTGVQDLQQAYERFALTLQQVALDNGGDIRAINLSAGAALGEGGQADGNSLLTQFLDWSSRVHGTLYVVAGVHGADGFPLPTDEYNGLTVAFTSPDPITGIYQYVDALNNTNHDAAGTRTSIDLVAPGRNIFMPTLGQLDYVEGGRDNDYFGTSFAAPHVTSAVALLQEYAEGRISAAAEGWGADARRPEVIKAVLMNSADKLQDAGDGKLLGMSKTIYKADGNSTWLQSEARDTADNTAGSSMPLDPEMGAGALNVSRAVTQFTSGAVRGDVPLVGWDYGNINGQGDIRKYRLGPPLVAESYIAATVTWDRVVQLPGGVYETGSTFAVDPLADLDLYLMPADATQLSEAVWSSVARDDNIEHMFFQVPSGAVKYELWVRQANNTGTDFAIAWWAAGMLVAVDDPGGGGGSSAGGGGAGGTGATGSADGSGSDDGSDDSIFTGSDDSVDRPGFGDGLGIDDILDADDDSGTGGGSSGFYDDLDSTSGGFDYADLPALEMESGSEDDILTDLTLESVDDLGEIWQDCFKEYLP